MKFGLFILDDFIEHLGPNYFSAEDYMTIVKTICQFSGNKSASLRQASAYGIGVIAQHGGAAFSNHSQGCLQALDVAVQYQMTGKVNEKKSKSTQFYHARDNAIASVGKVLKYQKALVQQDAAMYQRLTSYWIGLLPITHDIEEAQLQYEFVGEMVLQEPQILFTNDAQTAVNQIVKIFGEAF